MTTHSPAAATPAQAQRHLLSWVRDGLAGRLTDPDPGSGPIRARAALSTGLTVNGTAVPGPTLALHGPGDVVGIDPRQIIRTDPAPDAGNAESSNYALVEFDDPGLPWRLTPAAPNPQKGLRPWLVLVVVDADVPGVRLGTDPRRPLPVLETPTAELPDLARSAAWAHAEIVAAAGEDLGRLLADNPERTVSRLISPRRLTDHRRYLACLVPAFEHGRLAGLGETVPTTQTTDPAWTGTTGTVRLPVYHHWTFATGLDGDFPTLAARLRPAIADPGYKQLSYRDADPDLTRAIGGDPGILPILPALTAPGAAMTGEPHPGFVTALTAILRQGATRVTPPVYLGAHIGHTPGWTGTEPLWLRQLNTDPRLRAAAGLGAEVIRIHQEALMAAAWEQAAELARVNRELRQGQVGRAVSESLYRRYLTAGATTITAEGATPATGPAAQAAADTVDTVLQRAARAFGRLAGPQGTVATEVGTHEPTAAMSSADIQRAARPTGPAARASGATPVSPLASALAPVAAGTIVPAPPVSPATDTGVLDRYTGATTRYRDITGDLVASATNWWHNPYDSTLPLVTPGPLGYLTDLMVLQETTTHTSATATLHRGVDFDGQAGQRSNPFVVARDPAVPTVRLIGAVVHRVDRNHPTTLLAGIRPSEYVVNTWEPFIRTMTFGIEAQPPVTPYAPLEPFTANALWGADITLRRRSGHPDTQAELVLIWTGYQDNAHGALNTRSYQLDTRAPLTPQRNIPTFTGYNPAGVAVDMVPLTVPTGQPYAEPTDIAVALLNPTYTNEYGPGGPIPHPVWQLDWRVGRAFGTPQEQWTESRWIDLGARVSTDTTGATISLSVTDLDGDGDPELVVHLTFDEPQPDGSTRRITRQRIGFGLHPDGSVEHWNLPVDLTVDRLAPNAVTLAVLGDLDNQRLGRIGGIGDAFQQLAARHQRLLIRPATQGAPAATAASYSIASVAAEVSRALDPAQTIPSLVTDRITPLPASSTVDASTVVASTVVASTGATLTRLVDPLRTRLYDPSYPQAMADPLRELFPDLVFPAADGLPDNSVALMTGNGRLVAAYLAGLNHEFARELLWRGFPSSGQATWFRRFFDARGADPQTGDIAEIAHWGTSGDLAAKATGPASDNSVLLLVRGELLRRYPDVVVQAARAVVTPDGRRPDTTVQLPVFTGRAGADVSLFSFAIPAAQVRGGAGDPGWFFIFAEPPTEPRFGGTTVPDWTAPGAHTAAALLRQPLRVAIHASDLLAPTAAPQGV